MLITSTGDISHCLNAGGMGRIDYETETFVVHRMSPAYGLDSQLNGEAELVGPLTIGSRSGGGQPARAAYATREVAAFDPRNITSATNRTRVQYGDPANTLHSAGLSIISPYFVRKLTPLECELLQGFPRNYTLVPYGKKSMADGPRYKMLGNSMAVPCMDWLGQRIKQVDRIKE